MLNHHEVKLTTGHNRTVKFKYTNYKGEVAWRSVEPIEIRFGSTDWHPENQWLLRAFDFEKNAEREFALKDIQLWNHEVQN